MASRTVMTWFALVALQLVLGSSAATEFTCRGDFETCELDEECCSSTCSSVFMCQPVAGSRPEFEALQAQVQNSSVEQLKVATAEYQACKGDFETCVLDEECCSSTCSSVFMCQPVAVSRPEFEALHAQVQNSSVEQLKVATAEYQACRSDFETCVLDEECCSSTCSSVFMCQPVAGSRPEFEALQAQMQNSSVDQLKMATAEYQACRGDFETCVLDEECCSSTCSSVFMCQPVAGSRPEYVGAGRRLRGAPIFQ